MGKNTLSGGVGLSKIRPMLEIRDIRLLTPEEQSQRADQRTLDALDNWDAYGARAGRGGYPKSGPCWKSETFAF